MDTELFRMDHISKNYGLVQALSDVTFSVNQGEIVGLVGDNGAGKTTLIRVLSGGIRANSGIIYYKQKPVKIENTRDAINLGIETIPQDSALVSQLSIRRNLFLGREPYIRKAGVLEFLDHAYMRNETRKLLKRVGLKKDIDPDTPITALSGGERQSIAIARAMFFKAELIIMDEPTNNLGVEESQVVLRFIREAKDAGQSSIFITHNIYHVFQVVDRIVVLRQGRVVGDFERDQTTIEETEKVITGIADVGSSSSRSAAAAAGVPPN